MVHGVLQPRNLTMLVATRLRLTPGPELRQLVAKAGRILALEMVAPDDTDALLALVQAPEPAPEPEPEPERRPDETL
jgi:hypothetical protein